MLQPWKSWVARCWRELVVVPLLAAVFAAMVVAFIRDSSATYDEVAHLPAGYTYWRYHDYRLNPEHPPLLKLFAAWPLLRLCDTSSDAVVTNYATFPESVRSSEDLMQWSWAAGLAETDEEWVFGHAFLYGLQSNAWERIQRTNAALVRAVDVSPSMVLAPRDFRVNADRLLFWSRLQILWLGVTLAVLVFLWSRELFGLAGGVLSMALFCFDPNFIAHSGLVTTDVGESLFFFGAVYLMWRTCRAFHWRNVLWFLVFFGLAMAAKFSAVLLLPIYCLVALGWLIFRVKSVEPAEGAAQAGSGLVAQGLKLSVLFAAALLAAYATIWAVYGFRYTAAANPHAAAQLESRLGLTTGGQGAIDLDSVRAAGHLPIEKVVRTSAVEKRLRHDFPGQIINEAQIEQGLKSASSVGLMGGMILFAQRHQLLPEAFLYGFAYADMKGQFRMSFLMGQYSQVGFHSYFPYAFLLKTPLPAMGILFVALVFAGRCFRAVDAVFLMVPVAVYATVAVTSHLNIGYRHLLPIYPFLYVFAGSVVVIWRRINRTAARLVWAVVVLAVMVIESQVVFYPSRQQWWQPVAPHYLSYFNELAGGPANGYTELVDSNVDWGQELKALRAWLQGEQISQPIFLCYFGTADPRYYGISHYNLPGGYSFEPKNDFGVLQAGGLIVISATDLQGVYLTAPEREAWLHILHDSKLIDVIGNSLFVYRFPGFAAP